MSESLLLTEVTAFESVSAATATSDNPHSFLIVTITFSGGRPSFFRSRTRTRTAETRSSGDPLPSVARSNLVRRLSSSVLGIYDLEGTLQSRSRLGSHDRSARTESRATSRLTSRALVR